MTVPKRRLHPGAFVEAGEPIPGAPFDLVYARLLLFHVSEPVAVLSRLWDAVAPGGCLVVQDYDLRPADVLPELPELPAMAEWRRVALAAFTRAGRVIHIGHLLPALFAQAGLGEPDGTDVAGRLERLDAGGPMIASVFASLLPAAVKFGLTTHEDGDRWLVDFARNIEEHGDYSMLWPLMIGAWKRKAAPAEADGP